MYFVYSPLMALSLIIFLQICSERSAVSSAEALLVFRDSYIFVWNRMGQ
jgi:hypothetical protein